MLRSAIIAATVLSMGCNVFFDRDSVAPNDGSGSTNTGTTTAPVVCGTNNCMAGQLCDEGTETCVECLNDGNCGGSGRCEPDFQVCVDCLADSDCNGNRSCTSDHVCKK